MTGKIKVLLPLLLIFLLVGCGKTDDGLTCLLYTSPSPRD